jgi:hypothetical protein
MSLKTSLVQLSARVITVLALVLCGLAVYVLAHFAWKYW